MQDLRIAAVQMNCRVAEHDHNLATIERFAEAAAAQDVDIVCFPELCVCGYNAGDTLTPEPEPLEGESLRRLEEIARNCQITLLAGILERDVSGIVYNTQVVCGPEGYVGCYRKTHVPDAEIGTWRHGDDLPVFDHAKARYGIEICYDSHFPELSTLLAEKGAEVIFLPHASPGETPAEKRARWMRYVPARAYDNNVYVAICNNVGDNGAGRTFFGSDLYLRSPWCGHRRGTEWQRRRDGRRRSECVGASGESQGDADVLPPLPPARDVPALGERDWIARWWSIDVPHRPVILTGES